MKGTDTHCTQLAANISQVYCTSTERTSKSPEDPTGFVPSLNERTTEENQYSSIKSHTSATHYPTDKKDIRTGCFN